MSINRGIDVDVVHGYNAVLLNHKKQRNNAIYRNMESLATVILSQTEKDKYHMIVLLCGIKNKPTNELIYKTEIELQI